jgi:hypothetical protein
MIDPPLSATRPTSFCVRKKTRLNVTPTSRSKSASVNPANGLAICVPALLMRTSKASRPHVSCNASVTLATNASKVSVAPSCSATALRPTEVISSTAAAARRRGMVGEDDVDAVARERESGAAPDTAVGAGDECDAW